MKIPSFGAILACLLVTASLSAAPANPPAAATGRLLPAKEVDAQWLAEARRDYPLGTCVVADEKLGSMGDATEHVWRVEGRPDRLVKFCCDGCIEDFLAAPDKALAKVDAARGEAKRKSREP